MSWRGLTISMHITTTAVRTDDFFTISCAGGCENYSYAGNPTVNVPKSKVHTLEQAMKVQNGSRGIALLFL